VKRRAAGVASVLGLMWLFCYYVAHPGKKSRVENSKSIGLVRDFPSKREASLQARKLGYWKRIDASFSISPMFGEIAQHWRTNDLKKQGAIGKQANETITTNESV